MTLPNAARINPLLSSLLSVLLPVSAMSMHKSPMSPEPTAAKPMASHAATATSFPLSSYKAWLVDLDGTLYRPKPVKALIALELLISPSVIPVLREFRHQHERMRREGYSSTTTPPFEQQLATTARAIGRDERYVREIVEQWMIRKPGRWLRRFLREELVAEIRSFRKTGGKTAVVSDYPAADKLAAMGVTDLFDLVVANGEPDGPEALKPSASGFLAAAKRLGLTPDACLVIGDRDDADGAAARAAGMDFLRIR